MSVSSKPSATVKLECSRPGSAARSSMLSLFAPSSGATLPFPPLESVSRSGPIRSPMPVASVPAGAAARQLLADGDVHGGDGAVERRDELRAREVVAAPKSSWSCAEVRLDWSAASCASDAPASLSSESFACGVGDRRLRVGDRRLQLGRVDGREHVTRLHRLARLHVDRGDRAGGGEVQVVGLRGRDRALGRDRLRHRPGRGARRAARWRRRGRVVAVVRAEPDPPAPEGERPRRAASRPRASQEVFRIVCQPSRSPASARRARGTAPLGRDASRSNRPADRRPDGGSRRGRSRGHPSGSRRPRRCVPSVVPIDAHGVADREIGETLIVLVTETVVSAVVVTVTVSTRRRS